MTETFICRGSQIHFSNGMGEALFVAWSRVALLKGYTGLAGVLRHRSMAGSGCCATGIDADVLDEALQDRPMLAQWADAMAIVLADIRSQGPIAEKMDVQWTDDNRASVVARLEVLLNALVNPGEMTTAVDD